MEDSSIRGVGDVSLSADVASALCLSASTVNDDAARLTD